MNWIMSPRTLFASLLMLPIAAFADVTVNVPLSTVINGPAIYYPGSGITIVTTDLLFGTGPTFPDLTGASGNLIVSLLAPAGQEIEILAPVTRWSAATRFNGGSALSLASSTTNAVGFVNLSGVIPPQTGTTLLYENSFSLGELHDVQMYMLSSDAIAAGTRFAGLSFTLPVSNFAAFTQGTPLATLNGSINLLLELQGDQTSTAPTSLARFVDTAVPEPSTGMLLAAALALLGWHRNRC